jgi:tRNA(Ile)-lysidine synthase
MRLQRAEFEILQQLRSIPAFTGRFQQLHILLSGGKDSVALLQALQRLQTLPPEWSGVKFSLTAHHFNHKTRGAESDADEAHCADLARQLGVPLIIRRWTSELEDRIAAGANFHAVARDWRYESVAHDAKKLYGNSSADGWWICTAHHRRDHAETLLHNITRGCGPAGLTGILPVCPVQKRLRPLLWLSSVTCDEYIAGKSLPHREDSSNEKLDYTRNRLRHVVMKELEALNPKAVEHIWNLSEDFLKSSHLVQPEMSAETAIHRPAGASISIGHLQSRQDLHRFIAQHAPEQIKQMTREKLSNIFTHIKKCALSPNIPRRYNFALSDEFSLILTDKHLQITATHADFSNSATTAGRKL